MGAQGHTTLDFGAFPGSMDTSTTISDVNIVASSDVEAWVRPLATTNHSIAEHYVDAPLFIAGEIVAGTGFTVRAISPDGNRRYGVWEFSWCWN